MISPGTRGDDGVRRRRAPSLAEPRLRLPTSQLRHQRGSRGKTLAIADELRTAILGGAFADDELIAVERDLVEHFGVSRLTLREALRLLEGEGLLTITLGIRGGVFAKNPDARSTARASSAALVSLDVDLPDVLDALALVEAGAVRHIVGAEGRTDAIDLLNGQCAANEDSIDDPVSFGVDNAAFHSTLVSLSGNDTMRMMADSLREIVRCSLPPGEHQTLFHDMNVRRQSIAAQRTLISMMWRGRTHVAGDHWQRHMQTRGRELLRLEPGRSVAHAAGSLTKPQTGGTDR